MRNSTRWLLALCLPGAAACSYKPLPQLDDGGTGGIDAPGDPGDSGAPADSADAGATIDAAQCFGTGIVKVCLQTPPTASLMLSGSFTLINTDEPTMCAPLASSNGSYCVVAGAGITVDTLLRAVGTKPLVLVSSDQIVNRASAVIDVGSRRGTAFEVGAGADFAGCNAGISPTGSSSTGGGGAGGSFVGAGGNGGAGGAGSVGGAAGTGVTAGTALRGGCPGQDGEGGATKGARGRGGGAVFLIAVTRISSDGNILATGEGGGGGPQGAITTGGGGGGSGGMIGFDAPSITATGLILASGGGGGEGSAPPTTGADGADPSGIAPARGGNGLVPPGGDGGDGSPATGGSGGTGLSATNPSNASGGGGGGGAGIIKAPTGTNLGTNVSPPPMP